LQDTGVYIYIYIYIYTSLPKKEMDWAGGAVRS